MKNTFSLSEKPKTGNLIAHLLMRQYKLDKMAKSMEIKSINPKSKLSEIARELKISSSTLQLCRQEINMPSHYRRPPSSNTHTRKQKTSNHTEHDLK